jgi:putative intracellular protease/amidase
MSDTQGPATDPSGEPDEVAAFVAAEKRRHQKLIAAVVAGSAVLLAAGIVCLIIAQNDEKVGYAAAGALMTGLGALGLIRAAISMFTDIDTRDHGEWDMVVGNEDKSDADGERS